MIFGCLFRYFEPIEPIEPIEPAQWLNKSERASQGGARYCAIEPTAYRAQLIKGAVKIGLGPLLCRP